MQNLTVYYRFAWVRDASLSAEILTLLGDASCAESHFDWLSGLGSSTDSPLQVVYAVDGGRDLSQHERSDVAGYRDSRPVRIGNHAAGQRQLDSLGCLTHCAWTYLDRGGTWREPYWDLVRRAADYTAATWHLPDSGIWELPEQDHYVSGKVMSWVALDRAIKIAERTGHADETDDWRGAADRIHAEVLARGWSDRLGAFAQRYGAETLDASVLLIPIMGFLPIDDSRVAATVERIVASLAVDGLVHRFDPAETRWEDRSATDTPVAATNGPGPAALPIGAFEGAFLPATFWLATVHAMAGRCEAADEILTRAESVAGELGLFAEELDVRTGTFLGNYPLMFSQMEYVRAVLALDAARARTANLAGRADRPTA